MGVNNAVDFHALMCKCEQTHSSYNGMLTWWLLMSIAVICGIFALLYVMDIDVQYMNEAVPEAAQYIVDFIAHKVNATTMSYRHIPHSILHA